MGHDSTRGAIPRPVAPKAWPPAPPYRCSFAVPEVVCLAAGLPYLSVLPADILATPCRHGCHTRGRWVAYLAVGSGRRSPPG